MGDVFLSLVWGIVIVLCVLIVGLFVWLDSSRFIDKWTAMKTTISGHKREIELRKLSILEKNPELKIYIDEGKK